MENSRRDVPRTCTCIYQWHVREHRYALLRRLAGCPWHARKEAGDGI